jgi:hypothetical protein
VNGQISVGIFWVVSGEIIGEVVPLEQAEPYGDVLQHGGHYEFWSALRPGNATERRLKSRAYDAYARGRAVYIPIRQTLRVFVDACLDDKLDDILAFLNYDGRLLEVEHDEHYQCAGCNRYFLE